MLFVRPSSSYFLINYHKSRNYIYRANSIIVGTMLALMIIFAAPNQMFPFSAFAEADNFFYGDKPLRDYLRTLCDAQSMLTDNQRPKIMLASSAQAILFVNNIRSQLNDIVDQNTRSTETRIIRPNPTLPLNAYATQCEHRHIVDPINFTKFAAKLTALSNHEWKYKKIIVIFNFSDTQKIIETTNTMQWLDSLRSLLRSLGDIYWSCKNCVSPFIIQFGHNSIIESIGNSLITDNVLRGTIANELRSDFRATLISGNAEIENNNRSTKATTRMSIHINPIVNGCQYRPREIFVSNSAADYATLRTPSNAVWKHCDLGNRILNASVNRLLPYCDIQTDRHGNTIAKLAMETEILKILETQFRFKSRLINGHRAWGMLVRGEWNGVVRHVYNGTSDFALCGISTTLERQKIIDYGRFIWVDELAYMSKSPSLLSNNWLIARPFSTPVWTCSIVSFIVLGFVIYRCRCIAKNFAPIAAKEKLEFSSILVGLFSISMCQSSTYKWEKSLSIQILYSIWIISMLIIANSYSGRFYSILALKDFEPSIDTIEDITAIAQSDKAFLITLVNSSYLDTFLNAKPDQLFFYQIGQHIERMQQDMTEPGYDAVQAVQHRPRTTLISSRLQLFTVRRCFATEPLHIGTEPFAMDLIAYIFPKKSPLLEPFNFIFSYLYETGIGIRLLRRTLRRFPYKFSMPNSDGGEIDHDSVKVLAIEDLRSAFIAWSIGIGLAMCCFAYEMAISNTFKSNDRNHYHRQQSKRTERFSSPFTSSIIEATPT